MCFGISSDESPKSSFVEVDPNQHQSNVHSAESKAEAQELTEIVAELIAQLPQRQREVLVLTTYESLTNEQIAATFNINVANVHANLSTARKEAEGMAGEELELTQRPVRPASLRTESEHFILNTDYKCPIPNPHSEH